jgi:enoyl-CoA hydratase/carnithine racemase
MSEFRLEPEADVLDITIGQPQVRNVIDAGVARAIVDALDLLDSDPTLRVGVLTGAGGYFSAGFAAVVAPSAKPIMVNAIAARGFALDEALAMAHAIARNAPRSPAAWKAIIGEAERGRRTKRSIVSGPSWTP